MVGLTLDGAGDDDHDDGDEVERGEHVVQLGGLLHARAQQDCKQTDNMTQAADSKADTIIMYLLQTSKCITYYEKLLSSLVYK